MTKREGGTNIRMHTGKLDVWALVALSAALEILHQAAHQKRPAVDKHKENELEG